MKPPVNIDVLAEEWTNDAAFDETEPSRSIARIPILHAKYLKIYTHHNLIVKKLTIDYNKIKNVKWQYYSGDLNNPEDLNHYGYEPWTKKTLRQDIPMLIDSDNDLTLILMKKVIHQEIVDFCTSVLKELHSRTFQLKTFCEWERYIGTK
jgi:hypothetical protein